MDLSIVSREMPSLKYLFWTIGRFFIFRGFLIGGLYGGLIAGLGLRELDRFTMGFIVIILLIGMAIGSVIGMLSGCLVSLLLAIVVRVQLFAWLARVCSPTMLRWMLAVGCSLVLIIGVFCYFYWEYKTIGTSLGTLIVVSIDPLGAGLWVIWPWVLMGGVIFWQLPTMIDELP